MLVESITNHNSNNNKNKAEPPLHHDDHQDEDLPTGEAEVATEEEVEEETQAGRRPWGGPLQEDLDHLVVAAQAGRHPWELTGHDRTLHHLTIPPGVAVAAEAAVAAALEISYPLWKRTAGIS